LYKPASTALLNSSCVDISESFKALNDIKYHLTVIICLIEQFEMLFPGKKGEKSPKTVEKPRFARNRQILQETAQDLPGAPQFSMRQAHNSLRLFVAMDYFM
jgi:predicted RNA-binding Zn ribbon-like protein